MSFNTCVLLLLDNFGSSQRSPQVIADSVESRIVQAQAASGQSLFVRGREQAAVATEAPSTLKADDIGAGTGSEEVASLLLDPGDLGKLYF